MHFEFILLIVLFNYLRKKLQSKTLLPKWNKLFYGGMLVSIAFLILEVTVPGSRNFTAWIGYALLFSIIYLSLKQEEFIPVKSIVLAIIPLVAVNFCEDLAKLVSRSFYDAWDNYFQTARGFAFLWLVAMLILNNRQRKALEKERLKVEEKEKEFKITQTLKEALEVQVAERTAALTLQKDELEHALEELKSTQKQLIQSEKMASLGELTAGIAHEIQNPLNFVNNFSEVNAELIIEMKAEIEKGNLEEVKAIADDIAANEQKITHHGKRADAIVKGMLQHSRSSNNAVKEPTNINELADEYLRLAYHGLRAKDKSFNATMKTDYDESIGNINIIPQDIGRVILNLITNAFYAASLHPPEKIGINSGEFKDPLYKHEPTVTVKTKKIPPSGSRGALVSISVKDNGPGIPQKVLDKIFQPFFTTKPTGEGTGLGLSLSYDIVKAHGGELKVETKEGEGAEFTISLPIV